VHAEAHGTDYAGQYPGVHRLPFILFLLPVIVAYITPFYMGRCFILTFMGKPRDKHVHEHAHETILMYGPLIILAVMTLISGIFLFRPLVAESVPAGGPLVPAIDGHDHAMHATHQSLPFWVGASWIVGLLVAYLCYRNGFAFAERVRKLPVVRPVYAVLWNKFYFDHVYNFVWVGGCKALAVICGLFDNWIIDGIVNNSARLTERISRFSGVVLDNMGIDGLVNLVGYIGWMLGGLFRAVQTGFVRNYILLAVVGISGVLICILTNWSVTWAVVWVVVIAAALVLPWSLSRRQATGER
jgi:NADH-quinone oxidoreductase subunit L